MSRSDCEWCGEPCAEWHFALVASRADVGRYSDDDWEGDCELSERGRTTTVMKCLWKETRENKEKVTPSSSGCSCSTEL